MRFPPNLDKEMKKEGKRELRQLSDQIITAVYMFSTILAVACLNYKSLHKF